MKERGLLYRSAEKRIVEVDIISLITKDSHRRRKYTNQEEKKDRNIHYMLPLLAELLLVFFPVAVKDLGYDSRDASTIAALVPYLGCFDKIR